MRSEIEETPQKKRFVCDDSHKLGTGMGPRYNVCLVCIRRIRRERGWRLEVDSDHVTHVMMARNSGLRFANL